MVKATRIIAEACCLTWLLAACIFLATLTH